jgi:hypothetical protein
MLNWEGIGRGLSIPRRVWEARKYPRQYGERRGRDLNRAPLA